jgi:anti-sigma factor RsiW
MTGPTNRYEGDGGFPDTVLEDYAFGRLDPRRRQGLERYVSEHPEVQRKLEALHSEVERLRKALVAADESATRDPLSDDDLALFLDDATDSETRTNTEKRLAGDVEAQRRMIALYRDAQSVADAPKPVEMVERRPAQAADLDAARSERIAEPERAIPAPTKPDGVNRLHLAGAIAALVVGLGLSELLGSSDTVHALISVILFALVQMVAAIEMVLLRRRATRSEPLGLILLLLVSGTGLGIWGLSSTGLMSWQCVAGGWLCMASLVLFVDYGTRARTHRESAEVSNNASLESADSGEDERRSGGGQI